MTTQEIIQSFNRTERGTNGMFSTLLYMDNTCLANVTLKMLNGKPQGGYNTSANDHTELSDEEAMQLYLKLYGEPKAGLQKIGSQSSFGL